MDDRRDADHTITLRPTTKDPEAYDAFHGETRLGHMRLWEGLFVVTAIGGEIVHRSRADGWTVFRDRERAEHLEGARAALLQWLRRRSIT